MTFSGFPSENVSRMIRPAFSSDKRCCFSQLVVVTSCLSFCHQSWRSLFSWQGRRISWSYFRTPLPVSPGGQSISLRRELGIWQVFRLVTMLNDYYLALKFFPPPFPNCYLVSSFSSGCCTKSDYGHSYIVFTHSPITIPNKVCFFTCRF